MRSLTCSLSRLNLRMVMHGPLSASGGMMALTREPSLRRASTSGLDSSMRRPMGATMRSMTPSTAWLRREDLLGEANLALLLDVDLVGVVHHDLADVVISEERLERPQPERLVEDVGQQHLAIDLLGDLTVPVHLREDVLDRLLGAAPQLLVAQPVHVEAAQVEVLDQPIVNVLLQGGVGLDARVDVLAAAARCVLQRGGHVALHFFRRRRLFFFLRLLFLRLLLVLLVLRAPLRCCSSLPAAESSKPSFDSPS